MRNIFTNKTLFYLPIFGILSFVILFIFSTFMYPGGSEFNSTTYEYDWLHNYWCDLMKPNGFNGLPNPARPYSIFALTILSLSLIIFFVLAVDLIHEDKFWKYAIPVCGTISMILIIFIFTSLHRVLIILSSIFGGLALAGIIVGLFDKQLKSHLFLAFFNLGIIGVNVFLYVTKTHPLILPILQKISFLTVFIWIINLNLELIKNRKDSKR